jgi:hypothetical protein
MKDSVNLKMSGYLNGPGMGRKGKVIYTSKTLTVNF